MSETGTVILIDDDPDVLRSCAQSLELAGLAVETHERADPVLSRLGPDTDGIVVSDIRMPGTDGLALMRAALAADRDLPVVLITGHGDVPLAVEAMRAGAYDFLEKPFDPEQLVNTVARALEKRRLVLELRGLQRGDAEGTADPAAAIIGASPRIEALRRTIRSIGPRKVDVLITGETGAGKELLARTLHQSSDRAAGPFVAINCGALPESLIESELFGHEAGAFTGAQRRRIGRFEFAHGGTVFLDEIESMPLDLQVRLLRVLQERTIERVGSNLAVPVDVRVIAATKDDLRERAERGGFREDLYYRLAVAPIAIPALRERAEDIPVLFEHFRHRYAARHAVDVGPLDPALLTRLRAHRWPGNVRELQHAAERAVIGLDPLMADPREAEPGGHAGLAAQVDRFEKAVIEATLSETGGSVTDAHARLGIGRKTLYEKMQRLGVDPDRFRGGPQA
ncbi:MAG: sigma-54 dependent transcriptional regulator [Thalassobaculum sp.]|uniref:sigma-54-dependent transcriptional regulator n=1 Tax=Thalassobaculum sp. TaxID=2022740 RepID=UPI0032EC9519